MMLNDSAGLPARDVISAMNSGDQVLPPAERHPHQPATRYSNQRHSTQTKRNTPAQINYSEWVDLNIKSQPMNFNRIEPARDKRKPGENEIEKKQYEFRSFFFFIIIYLFVWLVGFFF